MNYTLLSCGGISKQGMPDSRQGLLKRITTAVSSLPVVLRFANRQSNLRGERRLLQLQLTRRPSEKLPAEATVVLSSARLRWQHRELSIERQCKASSTCLQITLKKSSDNKMQKRKRRRGGGGG